jgi:hypothetical protein
MDRFTVRKFCDSWYVYENGHRLHVSYTSREEAARMADHYRRLMAAPIATVERRAGR